MFGTSTIHAFSNCVVKRTRRSFANQQWTLMGGTILCFLATIHPVCATTENSSTSLVSQEEMLWLQSKTSVPTLENQPVTNGENETAILEPSKFVVAGVDNFNPGLKDPPPKSERFNPANSPTKTFPSAAGFESLQTDFRNDQDNFGQQNQFIEETVRYRLKNGNVIRVRTGLDTFQQRGVESVTNIPVQVGWEGKLGSVKIRAAAGADFFDRLPTTPNLDFEVEKEILPNVTLTGVIEQGAYKFNARTLDNEISTWRFGPNLYWQIDRNTSLFSLLRFGNYSDGNHEQQSFTRLERKIGQFFVAANLFNWSYDQDLEARKGYFSPPDFLVYNAEIGWEGDVFKSLRCRLSADFGRQRLNGEYSGATSYQARCTAKVSPNVEVDLGYSLSNVQNRNTSGSGFNSQSLTGQLRILF